MEKGVIKNRYGVSRFLSRIYLNRIDEYANKDEYISLKLFKEMIIMETDIVQ